MRGTTAHHTKPAYRTSRIVSIGKAQIAIYDAQGNRLWWNAEFYDAQSNRLWWNAELLIVIEIMKSTHVSHSIAESFN